MNNQSIATHGLQCYEAALKTVIVFYYVFYAQAIDIEILHFIIILCSEKNYGCQMNQLQKKQNWRNCRGSCVQLFGTIKT